MPLCLGQVVVHYQKFLLMAEGTVALLQVDKPITFLFNLA